MRSKRRWRSAVIDSILVWAWLRRQRRIKSYYPTRANSSLVYGSAPAGFGNPADLRRIAKSPASSKAINQLGNRSKGRVYGRGFLTSSASRLSLLDVEHNASLIIIQQILIIWWQENKNAHKGIEI